MTSGVKQPVITSFTLSTATNPKQISLLTHESCLLQKQRDMMQEWFAYEAIWHDKAMSFKRFRHWYERSSNLSLVAKVRDKAKLREAGNFVKQQLIKSKVNDFRLIMANSAEYPHELTDAENPVHIFYAQGDINLLHNPFRIALIGSRKASRDGLARSRRIARLLSEAGVTVVSGLAEGIDTMAHTAAIDSGGRTLAVLGTSITDCFPKTNRALQAQIAANHCLISQVPIWRYHAQDYRSNARFFPERNATMSAISNATLIIEAQDRSGTLIQASAA